ncbi:hypothetical protein B0H13DRAFT_2521574 [Mycena leptocephala]|nr:hypothetical protein B0H13DRAFT_2521574 [Mycena leptocephala]
MNEDERKKQADVHSPIFVPEARGKQCAHSFVCANNHPMHTVYAPARFSTPPSSTSLAARHAQHLDVAMGGGVAAARSRAISRFRRITIEQGGEEGGGLSAVFIDTFTILMAMTSCSFVLWEPIYSAVGPRTHLPLIGSRLSPLLRLARLIPRFNQLWCSSDSPPPPRLLLLLLLLLPRTSSSRRAADPQKDVTTHDRGEYSVKAAGLGNSGPFPLSSTARHSPMAPKSLPFPITLPLPAALVDCPPLVVNFTLPCGANSSSDARILRTVIHIWQRVGGPYALSLVGGDAHAGVLVGYGAACIICGPLLNGVFTLIFESTPVVCLPSPIGVAVVFCLP